MIVELMMPPATTISAHFSVLSLCFAISVAAAVMGWRQ